MKAWRHLLIFYFINIFHCALLFSYSAFLLHSCTAETKERLIYPMKAQTKCRHETEASCLSPMSDSGQFLTNRSPQPGVKLAVRRRPEGNHTPDVCLCMCLYVEKISMSQHVFLSENAVVRIILFILLPRKHQKKKKNPSMSTENFWLLDKRTYWYKVRLLNFVLNGSVLAHTKYNINVKDRMRERERGICSVCWRGNVSMATARNNLN